MNERIVETGQYVRRLGTKIDVRAKVLCTPCNNQWLSDLENELLKPAIQGMLFSYDEVSLGLKQIHPIAAFMFKTLIVANHKNLSTTPFFSFSDRKRFRLALEIPAGIQVWLASKENRAGKYSGFWKSSFGSSRRDSPQAFSSYGCTWNFQNVVLQALALKWQHKRRRKTLPPLSLPQKERWNNTAIPIWPYVVGAEYHWPPPLDLRDDTIGEFTDRWDSLEITFVR